MLFKILEPLNVNAEVFAVLVFDILVIKATVVEGALLCIVKYDIFEQVDTIEQYVPRSQKIVAFN